MCTPLPEVWNLSMRVLAAYLAAIPKVLGSSSGGGRDPDTKVMSHRNPGEIWDWAKAQGIKVQHVAHR